MTKPLIKRVGGKRHMLPLIHSSIPKKHRRIIEPFAGGGVIFSSFEKKQRKNAVVNDLDPHLISVYRVVRDNPQSMYRQLAMLEKP